MPGMDALCLTVLLISKKENGKHTHRINMLILVSDFWYRQVNMDYYSLAKALSYNMEGIHDVVTFYDINCAYMKKLQA